MIYLTSRLSFILRSLALALPAALVGCADPMTVSVVDQATGQPVTGALIERERPMNALEALFNPIGAKYHPDIVVESRWTDACGNCVLDKPGEDGAFRLYVATDQTLTVTLGATTHSIAPGPEQAAFTSWCYVFRPKADTGLFNASRPYQPHWDWQKHRPADRVSSTPHTPCAGLPAAQLPIDP